MQLDDEGDDEEEERGSAAPGGLCRVEGSEYRVDSVAIDCERWVGGRRRNAAQRHPSTKRLPRGFRKAGFNCDSWRAVGVGGGGWGYRRRRKAAARRRHQAAAGAAILAETAAAVIATADANRGTTTLLQRIFIACVRWLGLGGAAKKRGASKKRRR